MTKLDAPVIYTQLHLNFELLSTCEWSDLVKGGSGGVTVGRKLTSFYTSSPLNTGICFEFEVFHLLFIQGVRN